MGIQISATESEYLPPGFHIPEKVAAILIANGWERKEDPPEVH